MSILNKRLPFVNDQILFHENTGGSEGRFWHWRCLHLDKHRCSGPFPGLLFWLVVARLHRLPAEIRYGQPVRSLYVDLIW
jgi:hypothetical protein